MPGERFSGRRTRKRAEPGRISDGVKSPVPERRFIRAVRVSLLSTCSSSSQQCRPLSSPLRRTQQQTFVRSFRRRVCVCIQGEKKQPASITHNTIAVTVRKHRPKENTQKWEKNNNSCFVFRIQGSHGRTYPVKEVQWKSYTREDGADRLSGAGQSFEEDSRSG